MSQPAHCSAIALAVDPQSSEISASLSLDAIVAQVKRSHFKAERAYYEGVWHSACAGAWLEYVKSQLEHGQFERWRAKHLPRISARTCQRYMELAAFLQTIPEYPQVEPGAELTKAVRTAQLKVLQTQGFDSQRKTLAIASAIKAPSTVSARQENDTSPEVEISSAAEAPRGVEATKKTSSSTTLATVPSFDPIVSDDDDNEDDPDDHWATPGIIVEAAIELFGHIDLDPCGSDEPIRHLPCRRTLTSAEDSLSPDADWGGSSLVHPPLSNIERFVARALAAFATREANESLLVLPTITDAAYAENLHVYARAFLQQRPTFDAIDGTLVQPDWPYMLVFLTRDFERNADFAAAVGHFADVFVPYRY